MQTKPCNKPTNATRTAHHTTHSTQCTHGGYITRQGICKEVWSSAFFKQVQADMVSTVGIGGFVWSVSGRLGNGVLLMASRALRIELTDVHGILTGQPESHHIQLLRAAAYDGRGAEPSTVNEFLARAQKDLPALRARLQRAATRGEQEAAAAAWARRVGLTRRTQAEDAGVEGGRHVPRTRP